MCTLVNLSRRSELATAGRKAKRKGKGKPDSQRENMDSDSTCKYVWKELGLYFFVASGDVDSLMGGVSDNEEGGVEELERMLLENMSSDEEERPQTKKQRTK